MENKIVSLVQLTNLKDDPGLSETFVRYSAGLPATQEYKHQEIIDVATLLSCPHDS